MAEKRNGSPDWGYVLTDAGRDGLAHSEECQCRPEIVGKLLQCSQCLTVYGQIPMMLPRGARHFDKRP